MKRCSKCEKIKELKAFSKRKKAIDGHQSYCKSCTKLLKQKWNKENRKSCTKLLKQKWNKENRKSCQNYCKNYRQKHPETFYKSIEIWTNNHKDQVRQIKQKSYKKNYKIRQKIQKERYLNDPIFKLTHLLRTRINIAIKRNYKVGSAIRDLGCTIAELKVYLENKFQPGMSWDNQGKWHIDHIKPLSSFDLSNREEFLKACYYTNLQPLWAIDNLSKSNKII